MLEFFAYGGNSPKRRRIPFILMRILNEHGVLDLTYINPRRERTQVGKGRGPALPPFLALPRVSRLRGTLPEVLSYAEIAELPGIGGVDVIGVQAVAAG